MSELCVNKLEASKLLGVSTRMIEKYLHNGELTVHHREKHRAVMISVSQVYAFREQMKRKRGK